jgi:hypothetical protein
MGWCHGGDRVLLLAAEHRQEALMAQAAESRDVELAQLVEIQARWENLPMATDLGIPDLVAKQAAYEVYRSRQAAYNGKHDKAHDPPVLAHTPVRLAAWLRSMRDLFARAEGDPRCPCPVHLLEKARRFAGRVAQLRKADPPAVAAPATVRAAVEGLEALAGWCDGVE